MRRSRTSLGFSSRLDPRARDTSEFLSALDGDPAGQQMFHELAPAARLRGTAVAYHELEAYGGEGEGEKDAAAAWAAGVLDVGERPAAATTFPLEPAADDPWADDEPRPGDTAATASPAEVAA